MRATDLPTGRYFISHSYQDAAARDRLLASLPSSIEPVVFAPITVEPHEFLSTPLIEAIRMCDGLIIVRSGHSIESFWVTFEREFAARSRVAVYTWDAASGAFDLDDTGPTDFAIFPSYTPTDEASVRTVVSAMKTRTFDVYFDHAVVSGLSFADAIRESIVDRVKRGGYLVAFQSKRAEQSQWVAAEIRFVQQIGRNQVVVASIDGTPPPLVLAGVDRRTHFVQLWDGTRIDSNRIDDLIVRLCWLMYRNRGL